MFARINKVLYMNCIAAEESLADAMKNNSAGNNDGTVLLMMFVT